MILIGELSLWVALLMAVWSTTVSFAGGATRRGDLIESGVRGLYATFAMTLLASIGLWSALLSRDFSLEYVATQIGANTPTLYVFAAFWNGQAGAMLLWALILSMCGTMAVAMSRSKNPQLVPWATGTISAILVFFVVTICIKSNPFTRLAFTPLDGRGMNQQLQNLGMAIHPPMLYVGDVAAAIPFAFAIAALCAERLDAQWVVVVRRWSMLSWFFLTIGILFGMWSAYTGLGESGYWRWKPVETLSLLLWLANTAFLHSIIVQETRGKLRKWNVILIVVSFLLAIAGMFAARDGAIESGESFAQLAMDPWFATFFFLTAGISILLVGSRLRDVGAPAKLESPVSREAAFLYVGRNRRRYGGYIAHAGIVMLLAASVGTRFRGEHHVTLRSGDAFDVADPYGRHWRFVSQGSSTASRPDRDAIRVSLEAFVDGKRVGMISSERRQSLDSRGNALSEPVTAVGIRSTASLDAVVAADDVQGSDTAQLRVTFNPLMMWVWVGGVVLLCGGLIVLWPQATDEKEYRR